MPEEIATPFRVVKLEGDWWGVFLCNPANDKDRYLVTSTFNIESTAQHFADEFNRIVNDCLDYKCSR